jgi:hypothetical protein
MFSKLLKIGIVDPFVYVPWITQGNCNTEKKCKERKTIHKDILDNLTLKVNENS